MSQNRTNDPLNNTSTGTSGTTSRGTGGAGTGATDAGTTRSTTGSSTGGSGSTSGGSSAGGSGTSGSGNSMTTTGGSTTGASPAKSGGGVGAQAQAYGEKIADAATQAKDYVSDKMSVVGDKIKDLQNTDVKEVAENARQYARQNPGQALLISAAAGFLLGILLRGGRR